MKYAYIREVSMHHNTAASCDVPGVSRSGYYDWIGRKPSQLERANQRLPGKIQVLHDSHRQRYGSPRMHAALVKSGEQVSKGHVERLMRKHQIVAWRAQRHKRVYIQREQQKAPPNVLPREFHAAVPLTLFSYSC